MIRSDKIQKLSFLLLVLLGMISCTEIIDIDINSSDPQVVVEASIGTDEYARVKLTESINIDDANSFPAVEDATVVLSDNEGNSEILSSVSPGIYVSTLLKGVVGRSYNLKIDRAEKQIMSNCRIPQAVKMDTSYVIRSIYPGGGPGYGIQPERFYEVSVNYKDPVEEENFYRIVVGLNSQVSNRNFIFSDEFTNGNEVTNTMILFSEKAKSGDTISIEFQCIDKAVYDFYQSFGSGGGLAGSSSPANPYTNLTGTLLGVFSAHTVEKEEIIVN